MRNIVAFGMTVMTIVGLIELASLQAADSAEAARRKAELQRIKAEHQRRIAEIKRAGPAPHRGSPSAGSTTAAPTRDFRGNPIASGASREPGRDFRGNPVSATGGSKRLEPAPAFNAASAPSPAEALAQFVTTARSASTMDQLLYILPAAEARTLKECQTRFDPKDAAASQQRWRQKNPSMKEESIAYLTNPPYVNRLHHLKSIADKILDVLKVSVEGNKATLIVATNSDAVVNGNKWPFGKATIELVGEGNSWKLSKYNDSNVVYQVKPTSP